MHEPIVATSEPPAASAGAPSVPATREPLTVSGLALSGTLCAYLASQGVDCPTFRRSSGLDAGNLDDVDARIPLDQANGVWRAAERVTGDENIGLHAGASVRPAAADALGYAMCCAPTLGRALESAVRYHRLLETGVRVRLEVEGGIASFVRELPRAAVPTSRHHTECLVMVLVRLARLASTASWPLLGVGLQHAAPADIGEHERLLGVRPRFDCEATTLTLPEAALSMPTRAPDPELLRILERHVADVVRRLPDEAPFLARVRRELGDACARGDASASGVAKRVGVSRRTLQRRLLAHATSFQGVLDEVRRGLALAYLRDPGFDVGETAFLLGFARPGAFYHAFRRWTGMTPGEYRRAHAVSPSGITLARERSV